MSSCICRYLKPGGALVIKIYDGAGVNEFMKDMQASGGTHGWATGA